MSKDSKKKPAAKGGKFNYDIRPEAGKGGGKPAVEWQKAAADALAAATADAALAAAVASKAAADDLLAEVKPAYGGDPVALAKIAAASQFVMRADAPRGARKTWTQALLDRAASSDDSYIKIFCLDQIRWCGSAGDAARVRAIGDAGRKPVREFAAMAARELSGDRIGMSK